MQVIKKLVVLILISFSANASSNIEAPSGFVNDFAGIIDPPTKIQLINIITQFKQRTGNEIAVAIVKSLDGESIENYAVALYQKWGIGKKGHDNGILLLVASNDRQIRIEVGYGLEPYINDALAGRIIRDTIIPHFREGNFSLGILNGVTELISKLDPAAAGPITIDNKPSSIAKIFKLIFLIFIILLFIKHPWLTLFMLSNMRGGRYGSFRGGFGSGFGGFGGGLSGGGGASGRW